MALYFFTREIGTDLPRQREGVKALVDRTQCTDPEFLNTLDAAREFLAKDDQPNG